MLWYLGTWTDLDSQKPRGFRLMKTREHAVGLFLMMRFTVWNWAYHIKSSECGRSLKGGGDSHLRLVWVKLILQIPGKNIWENYPMQRPAYPFAFQSYKALWVTTKKKWLVRINSPWPKQWLLPSLKLSRTKKVQKVYTVLILRLLASESLTF